MKLTLVASFVALLCGTTATATLPTGVVDGFYWAEDVARNRCTADDMVKIMAHMEDSRDCGASKNGVELFNPVDHARRLGGKVKEQRKLQTCYCNCIPSLCILYPNGCGCARRLGGPDLTEEFVAAMEEQHAAAEEQETRRMMTALELKIAQDIEECWKENLRGELYSGGGEGLSGRCRGQVNKSIFEVTVTLD